MLAMPFALKRRGVTGLGYASIGSWVPPAPTYVNSNQPNVSGQGNSSYEPMLSLQSYLERNVLAQMLDPIGTSGYVDLPTAQAMLTQAALNYCQGGSNGGPNNPCTGVDISSTVQNLLQTYQAQVEAQGGNNTGTAIQGGPTGFTAYAPGYNSAQVGWIQMPDGSMAPNTEANLIAAQNAYYAQLGLPAGYSNGQPAAPSALPFSYSSGSGSSSSVPVTTPTPAPVYSPTTNPFSSGTPTYSVAPNYGAASGAGNVTGAPVASSTTNQTQATLLPSVLTDSSLISGIPNWMLIAFAALMLLKGGN